MIRRAVRQARSGTRAARMAGSTLARVQVAVTHRELSSPELRHDVWQAHMRAWAQDLLHVFQFEQHWASPVPTPAPRGQARLVVACHRSPIDILLLLRHFGGCVVSRADLAQWPVLGRAAREAETIFVDRQDPHSGVHAIREMRRRLQTGRTVVVFPEGSTFAGDEVRPFVGGAFAAARGLPVEVVPVGLAYEAGAEFVEPSFGEHMARVAARRRTRVALAAGSACRMEGPRPAFAERIRSEVQALVHRARAELDGAMGTNTGAGLRRAKEQDSG